MLDWDKLRIFHAVAEAGSFTAAGSRLNSSQSAVSRQIKALEENLDVALFTRHARGLVLTTEGQALYSATSDVSQRLDETTQRLLESRGQPVGPLRITTMVTFGAVWLTNHLNDFVNQYPELEVKLILDDEELDLASGQADVAIRLHAPGQADLIQRPLTSFQNHIYASPQYLDRRGTPVHVNDLDNHDLIVFGQSESVTIKSLSWLLNIGDTGYQRKPILEVNNIYGIMQATEAGIGLAVLPDYLVDGRKTLVRVLPEIQGPAIDSYFCYPPELRGSKRVAVLRDHLLARIRQESNLL